MMVDDPFHVFDSAVAPSSTSTSTSSPSSSSSSLLSGTCDNREFCLVQLNMSEDTIETETTKTTTVTTASETAAAATTTTTTTIGIETAAETSNLKVNCNFNKKQIKVADPDSEGQPQTLKPIIRTTTTTTDVLNVNKVNSKNVPNLAPSVSKVDNVELLLIMGGPRTNVSESEIHKTNEVKASENDECTRTKIKTTIHQNSSVKPADNYLIEKEFNEIDSSSSSSSSSLSIVDTEITESDYVNRLKLNSEKILCNNQQQQQQFHDSVDSGFGVSTKQNCKQSGFSSNCSSNNHSSAVILNKYFSNKQQQQNSFPPKSPNLTDLPPINIDADHCSPPVDDHQFIVDNNKIESLSDSSSSNSDSNSRRNSIIIMDSEPDSNHSSPTSTTTTSDQQQQQHHHGIIGSLVTKRTMTPPQQHQQSSQRPSTPSTIDNRKVEPLKINLHRDPIILKLPKQPLQSSSVPPQSLLSTSDNLSTDSIPKITIKSTSKSKQQQNDADAVPKLTIQVDSTLSSSASASNSYSMSSVSTNNTTNLEAQIEPHIVPKLTIRNAINSSGSGSQSVIVPKLTIKMDQNHHSSSSATTTTTTTAASTPTTIQQQQINNSKEKSKVLDDGIKLTIKPVPEPPPVQSASTPPPPPIPKLTIKTTNNSSDDQMQMNTKYSCNATIGNERNSPVQQQQQQTAIRTKSSSSSSSSVPKLKIKQILNPDETVAEQIPTFTISRSDGTILNNTTTTKTTLHNDDGIKIVPKLVVRVPKESSASTSSTSSSSSSSSSSLSTGSQNQRNIYNHDDDDYDDDYIGDDDDDDDDDDIIIVNNEMNDENIKSKRRVKRSTELKAIPKLTIRQVKDPEQSPEESIVIPKVTIKPIVNPDNDDSDDNDLEILVTPKITLKPIPKPLDITQPLEIVTNCPVAAAPSSSSSSSTIFKSKLESPDSQQSPRIILKINKQLTETMKTNADSMSSTTIMVDEPLMAITTTAAAPTSTPPTTTTTIMTNSFEKKLNQDAQVSSSLNYLDKNLKRPLTTTTTMVVTSTIDGGKKPKLNDADDIIDGAIQSTFFDTMIVNVNNSTISSGSNGSGSSGSNKDAPSTIVDHNSDHTNAKPLIVEEPKIIRSSTRVKMSKIDKEIEMNKTAAAAATTTTTKLKSFVPTIDKDVILVDEQQNDRINVNKSQQNDEITNKLAKITKATIATGEDDAINAIELSRRIDGSSGGSVSGGGDGGMKDGGIDDNKIGAKTTIDNDCKRFGVQNNLNSSSTIVVPSSSSSSTSSSSSYHQQHFNLSSHLQDKRNSILSSLPLSPGQMLLQRSTTGQQQQHHKDDTTSSACINNVIDGVSSMMHANNMNRSTSSAPMTLKTLNQMKLSSRDNSGNRSSEVIVLSEESSSDCIVLDDNTDAISFGSNNFTNFAANAAAAAAGTNATATACASSSALGVDQLNKNGHNNNTSVAATTMRLITASSNEILSKIETATTTTAPAAAAAATAPITTTPTTTAVATPVTGKRGRGRPKKNVTTPINSSNRKRSATSIATINNDSDAAKKPYITGDQISVQNILCPSVPKAIGGGVGGSTDGERSFIDIKMTRSSASKTLNSNNSRSSIGVIGDDNDDIKFTTTNTTATTMTTTTTTTTSSSAAPTATTTTTPPTKVHRTRGNQNDASKVESNRDAIIKKSLANTISDTIVMNIKQNDKSMNISPSSPSSSSSSFVEFSSPVVFPIRRDDNNSNNSSVSTSSSSTSIITATTTSSPSSSSSSSSSSTTTSIPSTPTPTPPPPSSSIMLHSLLMQDMERAKLLEALMNANNKETNLKVGQDSVPTTASSSSTITTTTTTANKLQQRIDIIEEDSSSDCILVEDQIPSRLMAADHSNDNAKNLVDMEMVIDRDSGVDVSNSLKSLVDATEMIESTPNTKRGRGRPKKNSLLNSIEKPIVLIDDILKRKFAGVMMSESNLKAINDIGINVSASMSTIVAGLGGANDEATTNEQTPTRMPEQQQQQQQQQQQAKSEIRERKRRIRIDDDDESPTFSPVSRGVRRARGRGGRSIRGGAGSRGGGKLRGGQLRPMIPNSIGIGILNSPDKTKLDVGIFTTPEGKDRRKPTMMVLNERTPLQVFEEDTRMSADSMSTPFRSSEFLQNEESQSSIMSTASATIESITTKKRSKMEVADSDGKTEFTVDMIAEYDWPPPKGCCPARNRDTFMIQEQIAEYLGVKSFKRKYQDLPRRTVEMEERNYLMERAMVSEKMCDLGLTAVHASDILDIMHNDFYEKYEEYKKYQREKQLKDLVAKQKAMQSGGMVKSLSAREQMIQAAASWNQNFNRTRKEDRRQCFDLQNFIVHLPEDERKTMTYSKTVPMGNYPIALVPGQYQEYYRHYNPAELLCYPINTALANPIELDQKLREYSMNGDYKNSAVKKEDKDEDSCSSDSDDSSSDTNSSSDSNSSDSDSSDTDEDEENDDRIRAIDKCRVCDKTQNSNQYNKPEVFVSCSTCRKKAHPSCIEMSQRMSMRINEYAWQCAECKSCLKCRQNINVDKMLYCDQCDRCYHIYCIGQQVIPTGRWHCNICSICTNCGSRRPEGQRKPNLTHQQYKRLLSTSKWTHEYRINNVSNLREHNATWCVPCARLFGEKQMTTTTTTTTISST